MGSREHENVKWSKDGCRILGMEGNLTIQTASMDFFPNVFIEFAEFSDKIFVITVKGLKLATSCVRDQDATTVPAHVRDRIFKLNPIHALVIYQILWICWIQWKFCSI